MITYTNARALEDLPLFFPDDVLSAVVKNALVATDSSYRENPEDIHPIAQSHAEDSSSPLFNCRRLVITYRRGDDRQRKELDAVYVTRPKNYKKLRQIYEEDRGFYLHFMPELERHISWPGICPKILMISHKGSVMVFENPAKHKFKEVHEQTWSGVKLQSVAKAMARLQAAGMLAQRENGGRPLHEKFPCLLAEKKSVHEAEEAMKRHIDFIETIARDKLRLSTKWIKRVIIDGWRQVRDWDDTDRELKMTLAHTRTWCSEILLNDWEQPNAWFKSFGRVRYAPLTLDLVQFVYIKCWKWVRSDPSSFRKLIKAYREQLRRSLVRGCVWDGGYPSCEAIANEFEELRQAGLHYAALYVPSQAIDLEEAVVAVANDTPTNQRQLLERLKRLNSADKNGQLNYYKRSSSYRARINEVVREIVEFGEKKYEKPDKARKEYFQQVFYVGHKVYFKSSKR